MPSAIRHCRSLLFAIAALLLSHCEAPLYAQPTQTIYLDSTGKILSPSTITVPGGVSLDLSGGTITLPANVVTTAGTQTLTNKTLTSPAINSPTGIVKGDVGLGNVGNTAVSGTFTIGNGSAVIGAAGQVSAITNPTNVQATNGVLALGGFSSITGTLADGNVASAATWNAKQSALTFSTGLTNTGNTITVNAINLAASGSGGVTGTLPASQVGFTQTGTGGAATTADAVFKTNFVTFEQFGAVGDDSTDDTTACQAALATGKSVLISEKTFKITASLIEKFNGRLVLGKNARTSIIHQVTSTEHAVTWQAAVTGDPKYGAGIYATSWQNMTLKGPGTYNNSTNAFSGSTGDGVHLDNGASYFASEHFFANLHIEGFARQFRIDYCDNTTLVHCGFEYGGTGLSLGGHNTNSIKSIGLITSNCATYNIDVAGGVGITLGLSDTTCNAAGSTVQLNVSGGAGVMTIGGNFESCSSSGNVVVVNSSELRMLNAHINKGAGTDNTAVVANGTVILDNSTPGGFTTPYSGSGTVASSDGRKISLGIPQSGGGYIMRGGSGYGRTVALDWERYNVGDCAIILGGAANATPTANLYYVNGPSNYTTIGHNAASDPGNTKTLTVEGTFAATGVGTMLNFKRGTGSPEGAVTGVVGDLYTRTDGGASTTLYVKESGTGNTGWIAK